MSFYNYDVSRALNAAMLTLCIHYVYNCVRTFCEGVQKKIDNRTADVIMPGSITFIM